MNIDTIPESNLNNIYSRCYVNNNSDNYSYNHKGFEERKGDKSSMFGWSSAKINHKPISINSMNKGRNLYNANKIKGVTLRLDTSSGKMKLVGDALYGSHNNNNTGGNIGSLLDTVPNKKRKGCEEHKD